MKVVIAIDSFKGSITSSEANESAKNGVLEVFSDATVITHTIADGGEGTVNSLCNEIISVNVTGPLGNRIDAKYGIYNDTAVIEMAEAAGLALVPINERNPLNTTTYGVGEIILDALKRGFRKFIIGIGGSATNDCGIGMLSALGYGFLDADGRAVSIFGRDLERICKINFDKVHPRLKECEFKIACDVDNPLCGNNGCSYVYGYQKGADNTIVEKMDLWIDKFSKLAKTYLPDADASFSGSGAAGGLGFAFKAFLNGKLQSGIELITDSIGLEKNIVDADLVITGEGRLDFQSIMGKVPSGVAKIAKKYNKPVIAFCGCIGDGADKCNENGIDAYFPILKSITTTEEALERENSKYNLKSTVNQTMRLIKTIKNV